MDRYSSAEVARRLRALLDRCGREPLWTYCIEWWWCFDYSEGPSYFAIPAGGGAREAMAFDVANRPELQQYLDSLDELVWVYLGGDHNPLRERVPRIKGQLPNWFELRLLADGRIEETWELRPSIYERQRALLVDEGYVTAEEWDEAYRKHVVQGDPEVAERDALRAAGKLTVDDIPPPPEWTMHDGPREMPPVREVQVSVDPSSEPELLAALRDEVMEQAPEGWRLGAIEAEVRLADDGKTEVTSTFWWQGDAGGLQRFDVSDVFAPMNAVISLHRLHAAEGTVWSRIQIRYLASNPNHCQMYLDEPALQQGQVL